jgi:hypothetical protein
MVFIFATGTMLNAKNHNEFIMETQMNDCDQVYEDTRNIIHALTGSLYIGIAAAIAAENACLDEEDELMISPE